MDRVPDWETTRSYYLDHISQSISYLDSLKAVGFQSKESKLYFIKAREAFKKAEPYAAYLNPEVGHRVNGPALPIYKEDNGKILKPIGFQKIEESIYTEEITHADFQHEIYVTKGLLNNLKKGIEKRTLTPQRFFITTHQQLFRIVSLGISGFDTPVSHLGINESKISLESLRSVYNLSIRKLIKDNNLTLDSTFMENITKAVKFIEGNTNFESFDRFAFTRDYMNPITRNWVEIRKSVALWTPTNTEPFNFDAPTFFEKNTFNLNYFTPAVNKNPTKEQIALGEKLFFDTKLSNNGSMSCATCHIPNKGYADGLISNFDNTGNALQRNTPTLINTAFQKSFFWDGRSETILDQVSSVFTNPNEFNANIHQFSDTILKDSTYAPLFKDAFGHIPTKNTEVVKAIASYISTLNGFDSKFDKNMRGEEDTFTEEEIAGYNIFMGKALCATCHFIPLTNGTVPPFFNETEKEVIGVPKTKANEELDEDLGFYWKFNEPLHYGMFKTPTIRNASLTAPYMHNGVYNTLEEVMDFYNKGGGAGLGFNLDHQTLPFESLELKPEELASLVSFVKTLTDDRVTNANY
ncbi:cytochrome c peroxidase [Snuella lapsa]|uniref:Cytochrome c peroxidase n=1 Tax=Snuella lapsa TaxID=870481 RepID=A0ABP6Y8J2_9FLAO